MSNKDKTLQTQPPSTPSGWIEIGRIVSVQGLKGELRVYPDSDFPERFEQPGKRWLLRSPTATPEPVELVSGRYLTGKGLFVVKLAGIDDRNQAEALRDCALLVPESDRPMLEEDEFHVLDLIDLQVFDQATGTLVGTVTDVIPAGNDLLEVKLDQPQGKSSTVLVPFVKAIVPVVDLEHRRIEITPPPGLIDSPADSSDADQ
ncbi:ribosome maturation factor RimM [Oscillatoria sp. FACHB-1407]|uniref:ribosome maturation factor RimM n=1 Tax=Oscillatoria sp. FACHB-1407 TaxID=2692847 RepID=UPI0016866C31|nr:ribosome maturation factor RimM [Oscillatoria sp. FACHB-1407]MBD2459818.1 ribosome maturation factor RimM [Oscillatoria sp. FACHB-1407]